MRGVTRSGPVGSPSVVFLHGGVINRHMWLPVTDQLDQSLDCLAIDLPGHGDLADMDFAMGSSIDRVTGALDTFRIDRAVIVGLSLGGYVAQALATEYPERVSGLVLSGATIRYTGWDGLSTRLYGFAFPLLSKPAAKAFAKKVSDDLGESVAAPMLDGGLSMKGGGQALRRLPGRDYGAELAGFTGPIVVVNGERDTANREAVELFAQHHPEAESVVIEDAGHSCALQKPAAFAAVVADIVRASTTY